MLEGVLRDGEDMAVAISYVSIRRHFRRLGWVLDGVTKGRLVVVEVEGDRRRNLVVAEEGNEGEKGVEKMEDKESEEDADKKEPKKDVEGVGTEGDNRTKKETTRGTTPEKQEKGQMQQHQQKEQPPTTQYQHQRHQHLQLASLRDWSSAVFGDPLLATVFSDPHQQLPSAAFLNGFNDDTTATTPAIKPEQTMKTTKTMMTTTVTATTTPHMPYALALPESIIESPTTAPVRLLLYQVYHAVARIVAEFYRPQRPSESSTHEIEARKKLNEVLAQLAEVGDDGKIGSASAPATPSGVDFVGLYAQKKGQGSRHHHRRPSGEMSPAKKVKRFGEMG